LELGPPGEVEINLRAFMGTGYAMIVWRAGGIVARHGVGEVEQCQSLHQFRLAIRAISARRRERTAAAHAAIREIGISLFSKARA
jgi:hypothetical protein